MEGIDKGDDGGSGWRLMMAGPLPLPVVCWRHTALPCPALPCPALPCLIGNFAETSLKSVQVTRPRRARTGAGALSASLCPGVDLRCEATRCFPGTGSASSLRLRRAGGTASPATRSSYYSFPALIQKRSHAQVAGNQPHRLARARKVLDRLLFHPAVAVRGSHAVCSHPAVCSRGSRTHTAAHTPLEHRRPSLRVELHTHTQSRMRGTAKAAQHRRMGAWESSKASLEPMAIHHMSFTHSSRSGAWIMVGCCRSR